MNTQEKKQTARARRHLRVRAKVRGTEDTPRLSVFRSAKHIYAQIIDDVKNVTIVGVDDREFKDKKVKDAGERSGKVALAFVAGKTLAEKAVAKKIKTVVFDRGGYKYHGRVRALAEGAREGGLKF